MITKGIEMSLRPYFILLLIFIFCYCGLRKTDNSVELAIEQAHFWLTERNCDKAIESLEAVGRQNSNSDYLQVYAASYACKAGYDTVSFFEDELPDLTFTETGFIGSLTAMSSSRAMTSPDDEDFTYLQKAIDTLLMPSGMTVSSHDERERVFGASKAKDMDIQAFYMILVAMGRWFYYYGNAGYDNPESNDKKWQKGGGEDAGNTCLLDYDVTEILPLLLTGESEDWKLYHS